MVDGFSVFPMQFVRDAIEQYTESKGYAPKVLCVSEEDYVDYHLTCTLPAPSYLGLDLITTGSYLKRGEMDLALGIQAGAQTSEP